MRTSNIIVFLSLCAGIFLVSLVVVIILHVRHVNKLKYDKPMWNVMLNVKNGFLYQDDVDFGNGTLASNNEFVMFYSHDKTAKEITLISRLLPVKEQNCVFLQTNGSRPDPNENYESFSTAMPFGIEEVIDLSNQRTVSCGGYLKVKSHDNPIPIGFDIAKGDMTLVVDTLGNWRRSTIGDGSQDGQHATSTQTDPLSDSHGLFKSDVLCIDQWQNDDRDIHEAFEDTDLFFTFIINGSTANYFVDDNIVNWSNIGIARQAGDVNGPMLGDGTQTNFADVTYQEPGSSSSTTIQKSEHVVDVGKITNATIWFDGKHSLKHKFHKIKKKGNNVVHNSTHAVDTFATNTYNSAVSGVENVFNSVAGAACATCKTINEIALRASKAAFVGMGATAGCTFLAANLQGIVAPYLVECPLCESIPISGTSACVAVFTATEESVTQKFMNMKKLAKDMCEHENFC